MQLLLDWPAAGSSYLFALIIYAAFYLSLTFQLYTKHDLTTLVISESKNASWLTVGRNNWLFILLSVESSFKTIRWKSVVFYAYETYQVVWIFSLAQMEHLLLGSVAIFFTNNTLISLLFAHSLCASGVRVNIDLTGLLGFQQLNTFNGNSD